MHSDNDAVQTRSGMSRRRFLQRASAAGAAMLAAPLAQAQPAGPGKRPNIVFIFTDDQRFDTMSCLGHPFLKTPHLDRLRGQGVHFSNAFVTISLCSPSRACFLTGTYAHRHGVTGNHGREYDPDRTPSFPQLLQQAGYETGYVGKWHQARHANPRKGFDYWLSFLGQGDYINPALNENGRGFKATGYMTDLITDYAVKFLKQPRSKPFCLCVGHKAVHGPFTPAARHEKLFEGLVPPKPVSWDDDLSTKPAWQRRAAAAGGKGGKKGKADKKPAPEGFVAGQGPDAPAATDAPPKRVVGPWEPSKAFVDYYRAIAAVDDSVGTILDTLAQLGVLDDTIVIFTSDNGFFKGEHGRADKRLAYEEALRVPMLMRYPRLAGAAGGGTISQMVLNIDVAPTLLDLAGVPVPPVMQGRSVRPLLEGKVPADWRTSWLYEYWVDMTPTIPRMVAVRTEKDKLIRYPDLQDIDEMYDLAKDPHEMRNVAEDPAYAERKKQLQAELDRLMKETGYVATPPRPNDAGRKAERAAAPTGLLLDVQFAPAGPADAGSNKLALQASPIRIVEGRAGRKAGEFAGGQAIDIARAEHLDPSAGPWVVSVWAKPQADGVLLAHGGATRGYLLAVQEGKPLLLIREEAGERRIHAPAKAVGEWTHLLAVLDDAAARLYVNGKPAGQVKLEGGIDELPNDGLSIGRDSGSPVLESLSKSGFRGLIESVRCYRQAVQDADAGTL